MIDIILEFMSQYREEIAIVGCCIYMYFTAKDSRKDREENTITPLDMFWIIVLSMLFYPIVIVICALRLIRNILEGLYKLTHKKEKGQVK